MRLQEKLKLFNDITPLQKVISEANINTNLSKDELTEHITERIKRLFTWEDMKRIYKKDNEKQYM